MAALSDNLGILMRIRVDSENAQKGFKDFKKELKEVDQAAKDAGSPMEQLAQKAGLSAEQFRGLQGDLSLAGDLLKGFGAIASAEIAIAVGLTTALFALANSASKFGSEIFDASEKTGLSAETLSSLKVAADQSGSSLEAVTDGFARFAKSVEDDGGDVEQALSDILKEIASYPPGIEQMTVAQKAFGRSGADLLPFIKSFDGDLPGLIAKCKALGLTLSDEDARAADEFGDTLDTLQAQAAATGRAFAFEFMPAITQAMELVSESLTDNQSTVRIWGGQVEDTINGVLLIWETAVGGINSILDVFGMKLESNAQAADVFGKAMLFSLFPPLAFLQLIGEKMGQAAPDIDGKLDAMLAKVEKFRKSVGARSLGNIVTSGSNLDQTFQIGNQLTGENEEDAAKLRKDAAKKRRDERKQEFERDQAALSKQTSLKLASLRQNYEIQQEELERQFLAGEIKAQEYRERSTAAAVEYRKASRAEMLEQTGREAAGKDGTELENVQQAFENQLSAMDRQLAKEKADIGKTITEADKKEKDEQIRNAKESSDQAIALSREVSNTLLKELERTRDKKIITEKEYVDLVGRVKLAALDSEIALTSSQEKLNLLYEKRKQLVIDIQQTYGKASKDEIEATERATEAIRQQNLEWEALFALTDSEESGFQSIIDGWNAVVNTVSQSIPGMSETIGILSNAFSGMANAIGNVVEQYVMYGNTAPGIMRQILASALATIAAEAAVRAVYALAMGFFFLATGNYVDATNAFISAAIFGSIAAGAALAGRAIAPKKQAQGAFNSQSSGSGANGGSNDALRYTTEFGGYGQGRDNALVKMLDRVNTTLGAVEETQHQFNRKVLGMSPTDVVVLGANGASREIRGAVESELSSDVRATDGMMRGLGFAR